MMPTTASTASKRVMLASSSSAGPPAEIVFLRHAESLGQVAPKRQRQTDLRLTDCDLSPTGKTQASRLQAYLLHASFPSPEETLVLCSPLTRSVKTALIAFPHTHNIVVHPGLAELHGGGRTGIPENIGRPWSHVRRDLEKEFDLSKRRVDVSLVVEWPSHKHGDGGAKGFFEWLFARPEKRICIVGHSKWAHENLQARWLDNLESVHLLVVEEGTPRLQVADKGHEWWIGGEDE
jgi:hypothetical protein